MTVPNTQSSKPQKIWPLEKLENALFSFNDIEITYKTLTHQAKLAIKWNKTSNSRRNSTERFIKLDITLPKKISKILPYIQIHSDIKDNPTLKLLIAGVIGRLFFELIQDFQISFYLKISLILAVIIIAYFVIFHYLIFHKLNVENLTFEKLFDVKSYNPVEAYRVLTPKFLEELTNLVKDSPLIPQSITFNKNKVRVYIPVKNELIPKWSNPKERLQKLVNQYEDYLIQLSNLLIKPYFN